MPALKNLNEKHCLALTQGIAQLYKILAQVEVENLQLVKLDQALAGISEPSGINLLEIAPEKIHKTKVLKTVLRGHTVHEAK